MDRDEQNVAMGDQDRQRKDNIKHKRKGKDERDPLPEVLVPSKEIGLDAKVDDKATTVTEVCLINQLKRRQLIFRVLWPFKNM